MSHDSDRERIDLTVLLPHVKDESDRCVERLTEMLRAKNGVTRVHTRVNAITNAPELCIHFDPSEVSISEIREYAHRAGLSLEGKYGHLIELSKPMPVRLASLRSSQLEQIPGVFEAVVVADGTIRIEYDKQEISERELQDEIDAVTRHAHLIEDHAVHASSDATHVEHTESESHKAHAAPGHRHAHGCCHKEHHASIGGMDLELLCSIIAGICIVVGWGLSYINGLPAYVPVIAYAAAYGLTGWFMVREALERLLIGRFEIDSLMLFAAGGAAYLGKWAEGALLLFLFSIGHSLESYAMGRARRAIEALTKLAPPFATVKRKDQWVDVPVEQLVVGDRVTVKPNERVSADGFVVQGTSSVNQAPVTGESLPVDKLPVADADSASCSPEQLPAECRVFAGTINGARALEIQVTKTSQDNTLSRIVRMVSEAETRISPTQNFTRKIEKYFVPAVLAFDVILLFAWLVIDEPFHASLYRAMAVLVAASPCALAISTPSAVLAGIARAASGGVLIKGGGPLESLGTVKAIAFDKTGTLTEGKPRLTDVVPTNGVTSQRLLATAIAVEMLSDHPLAFAIVRDGKAQVGNMVISHANDSEAIVGRGVRATVDGQIVMVGKETLFQTSATELPRETKETVDRLKSEGRTTMIVKQGDQYLGVLGVMDTPRSSASTVVRELKRLGIEHMVMLSGDHQQVAEAMARSIGLQEARGDLMPEDKVHTIQMLSANGGVAMVGDGVNDAPAMAGATVGIAMGAAGSDVALETADVALMGDDLRHLPFAVGLSRQTRAVIKQNLWISLGMVAFLVPATTLGLSLGPAVVLHEGSTLVVVVNALRLLLFKSPMTLNSSTPSANSDAPVNSNN